MRGWSALCTCLDSARPLLDVDEPRLGGPACSSLCKLQWDTSNAISHLSFPASVTFLGCADQSILPVKTPPPKEGEIIRSMWWTSDVIYHFTIKLSPV